MSGMYVFFVNQTIVKDSDLSQKSTLKHWSRKDGAHAGGGATFLSLFVQARYRLLIALMILLLLAPLKAASMMTIPSRIQAALFQKIFHYVTAFETSPDYRLLIVYNPRTETQKDDLVAALSSERIQVFACDISRLSEYIDGADVVYFMPESEAGAEMCKKKGKLSVSGVPGHARNGIVSISLGLVNDQPRIFINLNSLQAEGHEVSVGLLKYAQVYR